VRLIFSRIAKWFAWIMAGLVLLFLGLNLWLQTNSSQRVIFSLLQQQAFKQANLELECRRFHLSLWSGNAQVEGLLVRFSGRRALPPLLAAPLVRVQWRLSDLLFLSSQNIQIDLESPHLRLSTLQDGTSNWNPPHRTTHPPQSGQIPLGDLKTPNLSFEWDDLSLRSHIVLPRIDLSLLKAGDAPNHKLELSSRTLSTFRFQGQELRISGIQFKAVADLSRINLEKALMETGAGNLEGKGIWENGPDPSMHIQGRAALDLEPLARLLYPTSPAGGHAVLELKLSGPASHLQMEGRLESNSLVWKRQPLGRLSARGLWDIANQQIELNSAALQMREGQISSRGNFYLGESEKKSELSLQFSGVQSRNLKPFFADIPDLPLRGKGEMSLTWPGVDWRKMAGFGSSTLYPLSAGTERTSLLTSRLVLRNQGPHLKVLELEQADLPGLSLNGHIAFDWPSQKIDGGMTGQLESWRLLARQLEPLLKLSAGKLTPLQSDAKASVTVGLTGELNSPQVEIIVGQGSYSPEKIAPVNFQARLQMNRQRLQLESLKGSWQSQEFSASGKLELAASDHPLQFQLSAPALECGKLIKPWSESVPLEGQADLQLSATGPLASPRAEVRIQGKKVRFQQESLGDLELEASYTNNLLTIQQVKLLKSDSAGPGHLSGKGQFNSDTREFSFELAGTQFPLDHLQLPAKNWMGGLVNLQASGKGRWDSPEIRLQGGITGLIINGKQVGTFQSSFSQNQSEMRGGFRLPEWMLQGTISITGTNEKEVRFRAESAALPLEQLGIFLPNGTPLEGKIESVLQGKFDWSSPSSVEASLRIPQMQLRNGKLEFKNRAPIELLWAHQRLDIQSLQLESAQGRCEFKGSFPWGEAQPPGLLQGSVQLEPGFWGSLFSASPPFRLNGKTGLELSLEGSLEKGRFTSRSNWEGGSLSGAGGYQVPLDDTQLILDFNTKGMSHVSVQGHFGGGALQAAGAFPAIFFGLDGVQNNPLRVSKGDDQNSPATFTLRLEKLPFNLAGIDPGALQGLLSLQIEGNAPTPQLDKISARMTVDQLSLNGKKVSLSQQNPSRLSLAEGVLHFEDVQITGPNSKITLSGQAGLQPGSPLSISIAGQINTAVVSLLNPKIQSGGWVDLDLKFQGTSSNPQVTGKASCDKVDLALDSPPLTIEDLAVRLTLENSAARLTRLSGRLNGGTLSGSGELNWGEKQSNQYGLKLEGKGIFLNYPEGLETLSNIELSLSPAGKNMLLKGVIDVQGGVYQKDIDFLGRGLISTRGITLPAAEIRGNKLLLDLKLHSSSPLKLQNNVADVMGNADIQVRGNLARPEIGVDLRLEPGGRLFFSNQTYTLTRGVLHQELMPRLDPYLDLQASTQVADYLVILKLNGQVHRLKSNFSSEPSLSQEDVVSLLLTGKTQADSRGPKVDMKQAQSMLLVGGALSTDLSAKLRRYVGNSQVSIQPGAVASESSAGPRLTLTQHFTNSLQFVYSTDMSDTSQQLWMTEYNISQRFNARAIKQEDNTYRGEFRHQLRFGGQFSRDSRPAPSGQTRVEKVEFSGNTRFPAVELLKKYKIKPGRLYSQSSFFGNLDRVERFYRKKGFLEARARLILGGDNKAGILQVTIVEGVPVHFAWKGDHPPRNLKPIPSKKWPMAFVDSQRLRMSLQALQSELMESGYLGSQVTGKVQPTEKEGKEVEFTLERGPQYKVGELKVEGAGDSRRRDLLVILSNPQMRRNLLGFPEEVVRTLTQYYQLQGYLNAKVEIPPPQQDATRKRAGFLVQVQEGPRFQVAKLEFTGNRVFPVEALKKIVPLKEKGEFLPALLENSMMALESKYSDEGYRNVLVDANVQKEPDRGEVRISFAIEEGKQHQIDRIGITGNQLVNTTDIQEQLKFREGEPQSAAKNEETLRRLYQSAAFESVEIRTQPVGSPATAYSNLLPVEVVVAVKEPSPYRLLYGGSFDSGQGPGVVFDIESRNRFGYGRSLGSKTRVEAEYQEQRIYFTQPYFRQHLMHTTGALYYERDRHYEGYHVSTLGASLQQDIPLRQTLYFSYGYTFENTFIKDLNTLQQVGYNSAPLTASLSRDSRDSYMDPRRGSLTTHSLEFAPSFLGTTYDYFRYFGQYSKYFPLTHSQFNPINRVTIPAKLVFATQIRLGLLKPFSPEGIALTDRFFAGGGTSIRGFPQDSVGPKNAEGAPTGGEALFILNNEIRFPVYKLIEGVSFVDVGNVFAKAADFDLGNLRKSAGIGLRLKIPFFLLRFDYGFILDRQPGEPRGSFFFSIGQAF
jgi:outer membrane protein assembly complex protein YaeT